MIEDGRKSCAMFSDTSRMQPPNIGKMVHSEPDMSSVTDSEYNARHSSFSGYDPSRLSCEGSPMMMSPWNQNTPFTPASWSSTTIPSGNLNNNNNNNNNNGGDKMSQNGGGNVPPTGLIGSLVREEGHIYSLAARDDILYTGSDSKNIRVWKNMKEFAAFKSNSGLVKTIIISGDKIFTGHQDGKVRVWKINPKNPNIHKRSGTLPTFFEIFKASLKPRNYVEVKPNRSSLWIKHCDAISCLSMSAEKDFLYSASWDTTFKVWRVENSKCLESVKAHDDAINCIVASVEGMVYTGSSNGTVKAWRRETKGKAVTHVLVQELLNQEYAVNALAVSGTGSIIYCGTSDAVINYWVRDGKKFSQGHGFKGHKVAVLCLATAGKNLLFSGSADKTIGVWKKEGDRHVCLSKLSGHTEPVKSLVVVEDKESNGAGDQQWIVYSGGLDKSVKVWRVSNMAADLTMPQYEEANCSWGSVPSAKY